MDERWERVGKLHSSSWERVETSHLNSWERVAHQTLQRNRAVMMKIAHRRQRCGLKQMQVLRMCPIGVDAHLEHELQRLEDW